MRKRYVYAMLFGLPGLLLAFGVSSVLFASAAGFFWLFVFGDDAWAAWADNALLFLFAASFVVIWVSSLVLGFVVGKRLEGRPRVDPKHVMASVGVAAAAIFIVTVHQWSVGNIGPKSDGEICSDYCRAEGYNTSGMPPRDSGSRACLCYGNGGEEALNVPIERIRAED